MSLTFAFENPGMFNRYWRSYPWYIQLIQFTALLLVIASFFVLGLTPAIMKLLQVTIDDLRYISESSPRNVINANMLIQLFSSLGIFLAPALLFAYFSHPRPLAYLGLRKPGKKIHWLLTVVAIIALTPALLWLGSWFSRFDLGRMNETQEAYNRTLKAFLVMENPAQFIFSFFVMAILPGLSEELFFRGLVMRFAARRAISVYMPVVVSAILFASMHSNIYGMIPIFIAGLLLGFSYLLTGSIWCSIVAHICYNGLQVLLIYFGDTGLAGSLETQTVPLWLVFLGLLISGGAFYLLWKYRTPLPVYWAADYTPEEEKD